MLASGEPSTAPYVFIGGLLKFRVLIYIVNNLESSLTVTWDGHRVRAPGHPDTRLRCLLLLLDPHILVFLYHNHVYILLISKLYVI